MRAGVYGGMAARAIKGKPYFLFIQKYHRSQGGGASEVTPDAHVGRGSIKGTFILLYIYKGLISPHFS